jgi:hypothetical protein
VITLRCSEGERFSAGPTKLNPFGAIHSNVLSLVPQLDPRNQPHMHGVLAGEHNIHLVPPADSSAVQNKLACEGRAVSDPQISALVEHPLYPVNC